MSVLHEICVIFQLRVQVLVSIESHLNLQLLSNRSLLAIVLNHFDHHISMMNGGT
jgi:hypothetical protein